MLKSRNKKKFRQELPFLSHPLKLLFFKTPTSIKTSTGAAYSLPYIDQPVSSKVLYTPRHSSIILRVFLVELPFLYEVPK